MQPTSTPGAIENSGSLLDFASCAALSGALVLSLAACRAGAPDERSAASAPSSSARTAVAANDSATAADDPYDVAKMDFKTPPAVLSNERHSGAFASGDALSRDATVKPLVAAPVKEIRLDTTHRRFWNYQRQSGMRIPLEGEVEWLLPAGPRSYWRGRTVRLEYEFAR